MDPNIFIAIFILLALLSYVFILRKLKPEIIPLKHITKQNSSKASNRNAKEKRNSSKGTQETFPPKTKLLCSHEFGYLGTLPKNSKIPDECLGCSQIVKCLAEGRSRD